jgi:hypothetical protein
MRVFRWFALKQLGITRANRRAFNNRLEILAIELQGLIARATNYGSAFLPPKAPKRRRAPHSARIVSTSVRGGL